MLIKKPNFKVCIAVFYAIFFAIYFIIGFQPAAEARSYEISSSLNIPSINLNTAVTEISINSGKLETPIDLVGSYSINANKTLIIGHASGIFKNLEEVKVGDEIAYNNEIYRVISSEVFEKSAVNMERILENTKRPVLKIMTCAGDLYQNGDASHRLILTAIKKDDK